MKKNFQLCFFLLLTITSLTVRAQDKPQRSFKHIVTITFVENASQKEIDEVDRSFKGLAKLKVVKGYEWGIAPHTDRNKENKHTYAFTFTSLEDLDIYAQSPEHQKHMKVGVAITKKVEAVQYFVEQ